MSGNCSMSLKNNIRKILLICLILYADLSVIAQISDVSFRQITLKDGLSQTSVFSIYQDYRGFMWFGTFDGLNRYDGVTIKKFLTYGSTDSTQILSNGNIWGMDGDKKSKLFIATFGGGLNVLNYDNCKITHYKKGDSASILDNNLLDVLYVNDTTVWVIAEKGISKFNPKDKTFHNYPFIIDNFLQPADVRGHSIFIDKKNNIWIGTYGAGILKFNEKESDFEVFHNTACNYIDGDYVRNIKSYQDSLMLVATKHSLYVFSPSTHLFTKHKLNASNIFKIIKDNDENYWVTTLTKGVFRIDKNGKLYQYSNKYYDPHSFPDNMTISAYYDKSGNIWIGTYNEGAVMINLNRKPFLNIYHVPGEESIAGNSVFSFVEDDKKNVWIGTEKGLSVWNRKDNSFNTIKLKIYGEETTEVSIWNLFLDKNMDLWIATNKGVIRYNIKTRSQHHYFKKDNNPASLVSNYIENIIKDNRNNIWIATRNGLSRFDKKTDSFYNYHAGNKPNSISNSLIWSGFIDSSNRVWFCTRDGLSLYDHENDNFKIYRFKEGKEGVLSNDISSMFEVSKDIFWLATSKVISVFDFNKGKIIRNITVKDGLANGFIYRFLRSGNDIWISTNKGLAVIDADSYKVKAVYYDNDGISSNEFNPGAIKLSDGYFLFGGVKGITGFYPDKIKNSEYSPPIYFTELAINSKEEYSKNDSSAKTDGIVYIKDIIEASRATFSPDEKMFSFRFAALDYSNPEDIIYSYRLLPESKEWISLGKRNFVTFVNLNPGHYTLQVSSTNSDGVLCNNKRSIEIVVLPPFWKQKWVIGIEILLALLIIFLLYKYRTFKLNRDKKKLERIVNERTQEIEIQKDRLEKLTASLEQKVKERTSELEAAKQKAEESDMLKSAFLSNMSHEIRTPMNAIMGFSELLVTPGFSEEERKSFANMVKSNGESLLTLLNDIIDISMIESGQLKLNFMDVKLYNLLTSVYNTFDSSLLLTEKKSSVKLILNVNDADKKIVVHTDYHRLLQIMNNLVGNAIKFTNNGSVEFGYIVKNNIIEFFIKDTGIGIDGPGLKNIFKRFYKMQNGQTNFYPGNGLGLTITKNLVEALNGSIRVESEAGKGTTFRFTIPA